MVECEVMMKKNILKYFAFTFSLMAVMPSWAHIVSFSLWKLNNDKKTEIVVLGDKHLSGVIGKEHADILKKQIETWSKDKDKTFMILEAMKDFNYGKKVKDENQTLSEVRAYLGKNKSKKNVIYDPADIRQNSSFNKLKQCTRPLNLKQANQILLIASVSNLLKLYRVEKKVIANLDIVKFTKFLQKLDDTRLETYFNTMKKLLKNFTFTIDDLNKSFKKSLKPVEKYISTLNTESNEYKILQVLTNGDSTFNSHLKKVLLQVKFEKGGEDFVDYLFNYAEEKKNFAYAIVLLNDIWKYFASIADLGFVMKLLQNKDNYGRIVIYTGEAHVRVLNGVLERELKAQKIYQSKAEKMTDSEPFASKYLESLLQLPFVKNERICAYCHELCAYKGWIIRVGDKYYCTRFCESTRFCEKKNTQDKHGILNTQKKNSEKEQSKQNNNQTGSIFQRFFGRLNSCVPRFLKTRKFLVVFGTFSAAFYLWYKWR